MCSIDCFITRTSKGKNKKGSTATKEFIQSIISTFREKGRWLIAILYSVQLLCLFYSEFSFIYLLYWSQSMIFMVYGKDVYLPFLCLSYHLVPIWLVKNWRQSECYEEVYLYWFYWRISRNSFICERALSTTVLSRYYGNRNWYGTPMFRCLNYTRD